jgi:hypothetical protein
MVQTTVARPQATQEMEVPRLTNIGSVIMRHPRTRFAAIISRWLSLRWRCLRFSAATANENLPGAANLRRPPRRGKRSHRRRITGRKRSTERSQTSGRNAPLTPQSAGPAAKMGNNAHVRSRVERPKWVIIPMYKAELGGQNSVSWGFSRSHRSRLRSSKQPNTITKEGASWRVIQK